MVKKFDEYINEGLSSVLYYFTLPDTLRCILEEDKFKFSITDELCDKMIPDGYFYMSYQ